MKRQVVILLLKDMIMRNKSALFAGILAGLASPVTVYASSPYPRLNGSDTARLRGDVGRVGGDFSTVISRQNVKSKTPKYK